MIFYCLGLPYFPDTVLMVDTMELVFLLDTSSVSAEGMGVRHLRTSLVVSTAMLAASHAFATLQVAPTHNPEAAEVQAQETVKLAISGMT